MSELVESMKTPEEIAKMIDSLEGNIHERGWDPSVAAAAEALQWAMGRTPGDYGAMLHRYMERPSAERRVDWIARGGDPADWPLDSHGGGRDE